MWKHATDRFPEDAGWVFPMLGSSSWVGVDTLLHNILTDDFVSAKRSRLEDLLTSDDHNTLTIDELLGNATAETTLHVALSVND